MMLQLRAAHATDKYAWYTAWTHGSLINCKKYVNKFLHVKHNIELLTFNCYTYYGSVGTVAVVIIM